ncbi:hypothetical protein Despr_1299 [Desulfobulbus propionicus DSM 2032]|jgi:hypothetical protein|uniref:Uncharacterized protein n=1 Tax=Desulfobulbus propionicus (strain ATCC 33891 / DSM 2032 / VKM B-1956 / 1pr3) TaxID=577650 RepID=A0A7U3YLA0_DESPD|nr:hypothetical protein [Desulfobulbus propionicus]ADW17463.1 hypothetical protein Despr_1299 [Desulfobulbus propionicus DSM 2032]
MDRGGNVKWGIMAVVHTLAAASTALAGNVTPLAPLFANVNASYAGAEVIMPYLSQNDANKDGYRESLTYWYRIYKNNTNTPLLYSSTPKTGAYPAVSCTNPTWRESYTNPQFMRSGKWVVTGHDLNMECDSNAGDSEAHNTFVYVADVSKSGGAVNTLMFAKAELEAIELVDYNSDGVGDLMVSMHVEGAAVEQLRIVVKNLANWATLSDKVYAVSNVKD